MNVKLAGWKRRSSKIFSFPYKTVYTQFERFMYRVYDTWDCSFVIFPLSLFILEKFDNGPSAELREMRNSSSFILCVYTLPSRITVSRFFHAIQEISLSFRSIIYGTWLVSWLSAVLFMYENLRSKTWFSTEFIEIIYPDSLRVRKIDLCVSNLK